jgi:uncharacterized membrane protein YvbJ
MVKCPNCGYENPDGNYCRACGTKLAPDRTVNSRSQNDMDKIDKIPRKYHKKGSAVFLSVVLSGLGQIYLGLGKKGFFMLIIQVILLFIANSFISLEYTVTRVFMIICFIWWIYCIADVVKSTDMLNNGEKVEDKLDFRNLFWWTD